MPVSSTTVAVLLLVCSCATTASPALHPVAFEVVEAFDAPGDRLQIDQVLCDRSRIEPGATLRARGSYHLESAPAAEIYFGLTNGKLQADAPPSLAPGDGSFDLVLHVVEPGSAHVSLYAGAERNNCIGKRRFELVAHRR